MKERPILFSGPMVRAILDGRKTQTRRVVKPQPRQTPITNGSAVGSYDVWPNNDSCLEWDDVVADTAYYVQAGFCPYGQPGDRLWVREAFATVESEAPAAGMEPSIGTVYRASYDEQRDGQYLPGLTWRPSIFMPRWASRITLEVAGVRVERVQDITPEDAKSEGIEHLYAPRNAFANLWDAINAKRGYPWESNPWIWVVEFRAL